MQKGRHFGVMRLRAEGLMASLKGGRRPGQVSLRSSTGKRPFCPLASRAGGECASVVLSPQVVIVSPAALGRHSDGLRTRSP